MENLHLNFLVYYWLCLGVDLRKDQNHVNFAAWHPGGSFLASKSLFGDSDSKPNVRLELPVHFYV